MERYVTLLRMLVLCVSYAENFSQFDDLDVLAAARSWRGRYIPQISRSCASNVVRHTVASFTNWKLRCWCPWTNVHVKVARLHTHDVFRISCMYCNLKHAFKRNAYNVALARSHWSAWNTSTTQENYGFGNFNELGSTAFTLKHTWNMVTLQRNGFRIRGVTVLKMSPAAVRIVSWVLNFVRTSRAIYALQALLNVLRYIWVLFIVCYAKT